MTVRVVSRGAENSELCVTSDREAVVRSHGCQPQNLSCSATLPNGRLWRCPQSAMVSMGLARGESTAAAPASSAPASSAPASSAAPTVGEKIQQAGQAITNFFSGGDKTGTGAGTYTATASVGGVGGKNAVNQAVTLGVSDGEAAVAPPSFVAQNWPILLGGGLLVTGALIAGGLYLSRKSG
jgi:hypothetical protein